MSDDLMGTDLMAVPNCSEGTHPDRIERRLNLVEAA